MIIIWNALLKMFPNLSHTSHEPLVPFCIHWSDLLCGRSLVEETSLFIGLVCLHLHYDVVVDLSTGPAQREWGYKRIQKSE